MSGTVSGDSGAARAPERAWTDEQRRAIDRRRGDLLLDAAAGSGKTAVLVERFVRSVLEDGVEVGAILAITFTEKAAAELRERIRGRLNELGAPEAARATEGAFISTIHGFCARVLRAHALAAGLDPRFEVLDADRAGALADAAFERALEGWTTDALDPVELIAAYGLGTLRRAILSTHDQLRSLGALAPDLPPVPRPPHGAPDPAARLRSAAASVCAELNGIADPGVSVVQALENVQRALAVPAPAEVWPADLWRMKLPRNGAALSSDACAEYAAALAAYRAASAAAAAAPVRDALDALLRSFAAHYARAKGEVSGVDFEDLELLTRALFTTQERLRTRYAERFQAIMVDELQDTNRVQLELIEAIARENLFTVGDAQQSIYGFRHAEVELFRARGRRLQRSGARETLRTNFRTRPEIIDVLNPGFAAAMAEDFTPLRAGRAPAEDSEPRVELLIADKAADWDLEGMASPWRLAEARGLADRVAELVAAGASPGQIVVLMRASTDMRAYERALEQRGLPTYVIGGRGYWAHPQVVDMVAYLRALANPREEEALYGVLASPFVGLSLDGLVILAAGARAAGRDAYRTLSGGEPAIDALRRAGLGEADAARLSGFAEWFARERLRASRAGIEELIDRALSVTGYDLAMLEMPGGRRRLANVRKLMRLGREHEALHGPDIRGFLDLLARREASGDGVREGEAPVEGEALDAIRLMTIHRSKGLEFDIVCVADLGRSPRPPSAILRVDPGRAPSSTDSGRAARLGLRLARAGAGGRESALDYSAIGEELRAAEEAEERRLFYVAMTRARERLVLSGAAKLEGWLEGAGKVGGGPIAWIAPAFVPDLPAVVAARGGLVTHEAGRMRVSLLQPGADAEPAPAPPRAPLPDSAAPVSRATTPAPWGAPAVRPGAPVKTLSYSSLAEYARCGYRFYAERVLGLPAGPEEGVPAGPGPVEARRRPRAIPGGGRRRGVLVHALLERLDFRRPVVPGAEHARAAAVRAGLDPLPGPEELDGLAAVVRRFAASELCARLGRAGAVRREQRFAFALEDRLGAPMVVGALDVLAREGSASGERLLVVDYKTDRLDRDPPAELVARGYQGQQLIYALAALHAGAAEVEIVHCFLEAPEAPVTASYTGAQREELEVRLRALASGVLARRFPVAPDPHRRLCAGCPAQGGLCSWPAELTRRESADTLF
ncbi:MAG TPA: UvrD-helicase domain-containing protein [Solirubrobacteraceae bacterium]|nr:UvrD-helicase domain-containing protein [Solirubrobacteraceae bacterium]